MRSALVLLAVLLPVGALAQAPAASPTDKPAGPSAEKPADTPADKPADKPGQWSGYMFGDFYYYAANHDQSFEGQNGFWFRRIYLGYDREIATNWAIRVRMEANGRGFNETSDRLNPFLKDAYFKWTKGRHNAFIGLSPSPTWELIESVWGYRAVEKTPLDLQRLGDARDLGLAFKGHFDANKKFGYHAFVGTGSGTRSETDKDKKFYLALQARPATGWTLEGYLDRENRKDDKDVSTVQVFGAYETKKARAGVQYARQTRGQGADHADLTLSIASAFAARGLTERVWVYGRFDRMFDPNPDGAKIAYIPFEPTAKSKLFIVGLDLIATRAVRFMPNVELVTYDEVEGRAFDTDVIGRVTVYCSF